MNTFVERPAIQARLLYWLTALHAVNGMLYCMPQQCYRACLTLVYATHTVCGALQTTWRFGPINAHRSARAAQ
jgi:hypothetical protein